MPHNAYLKEAVKSRFSTSVFNLCTRLSRRHEFSMPFDAIGTCYSTGYNYDEGSTMSTSLVVEQGAISLRRTAPANSYGIMPLEGKNIPPHEYSFPLSFSFPPSLSPRDLNSHPSFLFHFLSQSIPRNNPGTLLTSRCSISIHAVACIPM